MTRTYFAIVVCLISLAAWGRAGLPGNNPTLNPAIACNAAYSGLGDVQPGATFYIGFRAYTKALALAAAKDFQLRRSSDNTTMDINLACNGLPNPTQTGAFCAATNCFVSKVYDQTGNGWDEVQATNAQQFPYSTTCGPSATFPCAAAVSGNTADIYSTAAATLAFNAPNSLWAVESSFNSFNNTGYIAVCGVGATNEQLYSKNFGGNNSFALDVSTSPGTILLSSGSAVFGVVKDKLGIFNGATSAFYVNGAAAITGPLDPFNCTGTAQFQAMSSSGRTFEIAGYASDVSGNYAAMRANARAVWGY